MANISDYLVLYYPFDESDGSQTAYDYSVNRLDAQVSGGSFVAGRIGNAIKFTGSDKAVAISNPLSFRSDFTISALVKGLKGNPGDTEPKKVGWLINLSGDNNFIEYWFDAEPDVWTHIVLVKNGASLRFYINGAQVEEVHLDGVIIGVSINQDYYGKEFGRGSIDEFQLYSTALTQTEILSLFDNAVKLEYFLDGKNLKDEYGVRVSDSIGVIDGLKMKDPFTVAFDDENGEFVDLEDPVFQPREITLKCWIKADGKADFVDKVALLESQFRKSRTRRLMIVTNPTRPLVYEVYAPNGIAVDKKWRDDVMIGTFSLNLREPEPVKRVLKHIVVNAASRVCTISLKSDRFYNVYWGDGESDLDVGGSADTVTLQHTYADNGDYYPIITGVVKQITEFSSNAILVWSEL